MKITLNLVDLPHQPLNESFFQVVMLLWGTLPFDSQLGHVTCFAIRTSKNVRHICNYFLECCCHPVRMRSMISLRMKVYTEIWPAFGAVPAGPAPAVPLTEWSQMNKPRKSQQKWLANPQNREKLCFGFFFLTHYILGGGVLHNNR